MYFTMQDYSNIPLQFLLNKKMFERAHSVCIYATRIDRYFSETYLSLLQPKTRLTIGYFEADEDTRIYLENLIIRRLSLVPGAGKSVDLLSKILISGSDFNISIVTVSGLTQFDFDRDETRLWYSADEDEYNSIHHSILKTIYSNPSKPRK